MAWHVELEQETDGRWIGEIPELPGVLVYGETRAQVEEKARALAEQVFVNLFEFTPIH
jgi:predicted RNase H-like HicB family nuclease